MEDLGYPALLSCTTVPHTGSPPDKQDGNAMAKHIGLEFSLGGRVIF